MSIAKETKKYINTHRSIRDCLSQDLINYSKLAVLIQKKIGKKASKEAILQAARRYEPKPTKENKIIELFEKSDITIKNNIVTFTLSKNIYSDILLQLEKKIKTKGGVYYSIEGTKSITLIVQEKYAKQISEQFPKSKKKEELALIQLSSDGIGQIPGAVTFISGLFYDNDINIEEFMSCYQDTLIVVRSKDVSLATKVLSF